MNPEEYVKLDRLDHEHWFYTGKRAIVRHWIDRCVTLGAHDLLIDAGMGTGTFLVEMSRRCHVIGLDDHDESLAIAQPRLEAVGGQTLKTTLNRVPLADGCATVVTMLDVLEHLDDDAAALQEMIRLTRPGGLLIVTVPALRWLWSDWDESLHHRRRYNRSDLLRQVRRDGVEVVHCTYMNSLLLPPIALVRAWRKVRPPRPGSPRAEDVIPPAPINALLRSSFVVPACQSWFRPPAGVSLLAVLRRAG